MPKKLYNVQFMLGENINKRYLRRNAIFLGYWQARRVVPAIAELLASCSKQPILALAEHETSGGSRGHAPHRHAGVSYELVNLSFIIFGHRKWPHLAITSILWKRPSNGEQITGNSSSFRHLKRCKIMPKIHQNMVGSRAPPGPVGELQHSSRLPRRNQGVPTSKGPTSKAVSYTHLTLPTILRV